MYSLLVRNTSDIQQTKNLVVQKYFEHEIILITGINPFPQGCIECKRCIVKDFGKQGGRKMMITKKWKLKEGTGMRNMTNNSKM